jgi:hypothetical protein
MAVIGFLVGETEDEDDRVFVLLGTGLPVFFIA